MEDLHLFFYDTTFPSLDNLLSCLDSSSLFYVEANVHVLSIQKH